MKELAEAAAVEPSVPLSGGGFELLLEALRGPQASGPMHVRTVMAGAVLEYLLNEAQGERLDQLCQLSLVAPIIKGVKTWSGQPHAHRYCTALASQCAASAAARAAVLADGEAVRALLETAAASRREAFCSTAFGVLGVLSEHDARTARRVSKNEEVIDGLFASLPDHLSSGEGPDTLASSRLLRALYQSEAAAASALVVAREAEAATLALRVMRAAEQTSCTAAVIRGSFVNSAMTVAALLRDGGRRHPNAMAKIAGKECINVLLRSACGVQEVKCIPDALRALLAAARCLETRKALAFNAPLPAALARMLTGGSGGGGNGSGNGGSGGGRLSGEAAALFLECLDQLWDVTRVDDATVGQKLAVLALASPAVRSSLAGVAAGRLAACGPRRRPDCQLAAAAAVVWALAAGAEECGARSAEQLRAVSREVAGAAAEALAVLLQDDAEEQEQGSSGANGSGSTNRAAGGSSSGNYRDEAVSKLLLALVCLTGSNAGEETTRAVATQQPQLAEALKLRPRGANALVPELERTLLRRLTGARRLMELEQQQQQQQQQRVASPPAAGMAERLEGLSLHTSSPAGGGATSPVGAASVCTGCGKPAAEAGVKLKTCSGCRMPQFRYCSTECYHADWKRGHKQVCKAVQAARAASDCGAVAEHAVQQP